MDKGEKTTWWTVGKIGMILIIRVMQKKTVWQEEKCHKRAKGQNCDSGSKKSCSKQRIGIKKIQTFTVKICKSQFSVYFGKAANTSSKNAFAYSETGCNCQKARSYSYWAQSKKSVKLPESAKILSNKINSKKPRKAYFFNSLPLPPYHSYLSKTDKVW